MHTPDAGSPRVVVMGLGERSKFEPDKVRSVMARGARVLRRMGAKKVAVPSHGHLGLPPRQVANLIAEGIGMGLYRFRKYQTREKTDANLDVLIAADNLDAGELEAGARRGTILAEHVNRCRDLINEPANHMTPTILASQAAALARDSGVEFKALGPEEMKHHGMGALLGVAQGSQEPPRMIVMQYRGAGPGQPVLGFVGKGITFDSGGLSLKDAEGMYRMYSDMSGAAAVITAVAAIAHLGLKVNVFGVSPTTENMPSGTAYRPGDILKSMDGKTIEILNTDAEGRLALADGLAYARHLGANCLIDVATLTGACAVALGRVASGIFTNHPPLADLVRRAGDDCGERYWPLPLYEEYMDMIRSDVADLENTGGRYGGASTAAIFLREFTGGLPWVHLDIAPTALIDDKTLYASKLYLPKEGGSGVAVRTLVGTAEAFATNPIEAKGA